MRKFAFGMLLVFGQFPVAVFGNDVHIVSTASSGGTSRVYGTAAGGGRLKIEGHASHGGATALSGHSEGDSRLLMQGDSRGRGAVAESTARVVGRSGGVVDARSINQAYHGVSRNALSAEASQGGVAVIDQVSSVRRGHGENVIEGNAAGGTVDMIGTIAVDRGIGQAKLNGESRGSRASTMQELLLDVYRGEASGTMKAETVAGEGFAHSESLGVVRGGVNGSVYSESSQRTDGRRARAVSESHFRSR